MTFRIVVRATPRKEDQDRFEAAYRQVTETVRGTPGHLRDELLRDTGDGRTYILLAEWESEQAFRAWEDDPGHLRMAAPMLPYWGDDGVERRIFEVRARLDSV
ncbi:MULTISPECIES: antibiotic biosynthesis monooxygenase family protein [Thermomonosporaceae]|uniref:antibiotic biosynthesis monooxygenase family protein n=1 Tax=Thermomonosporaceae TaxID=2012 RepID=UPI00255B2480|nr:MULTISPECIES: antibiotic biosynthesis monooxygenase family protein [Thermomonosporaceae]MDL4774107.1 antibiotic biosynthesis monooxygenase family protein [Actinomadura xylanilytica]